MDRPTVYNYAIHLAQYPLLDINLLIDLLRSDTCPQIQIPFPDTTPIAYQIPILLTFLSSNIICGVQPA